MLTAGVFGDKVGSGKEVLARWTPQSTISRYMVSLPTSITQSLLPRLHFSALPTRSPSLIAPLQQIDRGNPDFRVGTHETLMKRIY